MTCPRSSGHRTWHDLCARRGVLDACTEAAGVPSSRFELARLREKQIAHAPYWTVSLSPRILDRGDSAPRRAVSANNLAGLHSPSQADPVPQRAKALAAIAPTWRRTALHR